MLFNILIFIEKSLESWFYPRHEFEANLVNFGVLTQNCRTTGAGNTKAREWEQICPKRNEYLVQKPSESMETGPPRGVPCSAHPHLSILSEGQYRIGASLRDGQQKRRKSNFSSFKSSARLLQPCHKPRSAFAKRGFPIPLFSTAVFPGPETKTKLPFHTLLFCPSAPYPSVSVCLEPPLRSPSTFKEPL